MSKTSTLLDLVCAQRRQMRIIIALAITMGLFLLLSLLFVEPGDRSYPILIIDIVLVVAALLFFGATHWYCTRRAMDD